MKSIEHFGWIGTGGPDPFLDLAIGLVVVGMALASCTATYLVFYLVQRFVFKKPKFNWRILLTALVVGLFIFPGSYYAREAKDNKVWTDIQQSCAQDAGYAHPGEDGNPETSTWESQYIYQRCIQSALDHRDNLN